MYVRDFLLSLVSFYRQRICNGQITSGTDILKICTFKIDCESQQARLITLRQPKERTRIRCDVEKTPSHFGYHDWAECSESKFAFRQYAPGSDLATHCGRHVLNMLTLV